MNNPAAERTEQIFNLLGLARRAGKLLVGQDKVLSAAKSGAALLVVTSNDLAAAVERSLKPHAERGFVTKIVIADYDRAALGTRLGVSSAQIVALPKEDGLSRKILNIFNDGSDAYE